MHLKLRYILQIILFVFFAGNIQKNEAAPAFNSSKQIDRSAYNPAIWRIRKNHITDYIFGTIHIGHESMYPLPKKITHALDQADNFVLEVNLDSKNLLKVQLFILENGTYQEGDLESHLSTENWQRLERHMISNKLQISFLKKYKPWALAIYLAEIEFHKVNLRKDLGVETVLKKQAGNKTIIELETVEFQLNLMAGLSNELQESMILQSMDNSSQQLLELLDAWKSGNIDKLLKFYLDLDMDKKIQEAFIKKLLTDRNITMVASIEKLLNNKHSDFITAGAGHMVGKQGIIERLRAKGYQVERF